MRITLGGSAANPPHRGHKQMVKGLLISGLFDKVIWLPSGTRPEKPHLVEPNHRVAMTQLTFPKEWLWATPTEFEINYDDAYKPNTPTIEILERYRAHYPEAEISWFTGSDIVWPNPALGGSCELETWVRGNELLAHWPFYIVPRAEFPCNSQAQLPPQFTVLAMQLHDTASSTIRQLISCQEPFEHLVTAPVAAYIKRHGLYGYKGGTQ